MTTSSAPVTWQLLIGDAWMPLDAWTSSKMEGVFDRSYTSNMIDASVGSISTSAPLEIDKMTWANMPVRRDKIDTISTVEFWDDDAWVAYNVHATGLIMDALRYGHRQVRLYVGPTPYDITLDKGNELQTNTGTMRQRPVRVPSVAKLVGTLKDDGVVLPDVPDEIHLPQEFICPITSAPMSFPVIADDGHSYQLQAIERWFGTKLSSPVTGLPLASANLTPNHALRKLIRDCLGVADASTSSASSAKVAKKIVKRNKKLGKKPTANSDSDE